jgi:hypothetical protein
VSVARWEAELPAAAGQYLLEMLEIGEAVVQSARPAVVIAGPAPAPEPSSAEKIAAAVAGIAGLVQVSVAERPHPLWLRAGTADAPAAIKSLALPPGGFKIPFVPRRILEIGAGAGYRSVALACAYPQAEILTTEPDAGGQRVALLNTLPYRNISAAFLAVSTDTSRFGFTGRHGEPGYPALMRDDAGPLAAVQLKNFLYGRGWLVYDTVVISPDAASDHLLRTPWPACVKLLAVETGGVPLHEATAARFPDEKFLTVIEGDYVLLHRREADAAAPPPRAIPVFNPEGPARRLTLTEVTAKPPGFFPLGAHGFRLHPNASGTPAARLALAAVSWNFTELHWQMRVALASAAPVRFGVTVTAEGRELLRAAEVLKGGETRAVVVPMEAHEGPCEVVFTTEMAEFEADNAGAWAEVLAAVFI